MEGPETLETFLLYINGYHDTIKFTHVKSSTGVDFLDTHVHKGPRFESSGILDFSPHFKATNCFQYLHFASAHPRATFAGIVKGGTFENPKGFLGSANVRQLCQVAPRQIPDASLSRQGLEGCIKSGAVLGSGQRLVLGEFGRAWGEKTGIHFQTYGYYPQTSTHFGTETPGLHSPTPSLLHEGYQPRGQTTDTITQGTITQIINFSSVSLEIVLISVILKTSFQCHHGFSTALASGELSRPPATTEITTLSPSRLPGDSILLGNEIDADDFLLQDDCNYKEPSFELTIPVNRKQTERNEYPMQVEPSQANIPKRLLDMRKAYKKNVRYCLC